MTQEIQFKTVTVEIPVFVTVANIHGDTGAYAIQAACEALDFKALIDRNPRGYSEHLAPGTVLEVFTKELPVAGVATTAHEAAEVSCSYRVADDGDVLPCDIRGRNELLDALRAIDTHLRAADSTSSENPRHCVELALDVLDGLGINTTPTPPEDALFHGVEPTPPNAYFHERQGLGNRPESSLIEQLRGLLGPNPESTSVIMQTAIFVNSANSNLDGESQAGWGIQFGEIEVLHAGTKIAAIGTWREFGAPGVPYFDDPVEIQIARTALLQLNEIPAFSLERPNLPDRISAEIDL